MVQSNLIFLESNTCTIDAFSWELWSTQYQLIRQIQRRKLRIGRNLWPTIPKWLYKTVERSFVETIHFMHTVFSRLMNLLAIYLPRFYMGWTVLPEEQLLIWHFAKLMRPFELWSMELATIFFLILREMAKVSIRDRVIFGPIW